MPDRMQEWLNFLNWCTNVFACRFLLPKVSTFAESTKPTKSNVNVYLSLYFLHVKTSLNLHPGTGTGTCTQALWGFRNARPFLFIMVQNHRLITKFCSPFRLPELYKAKKGREEPNFNPHKVLKFYRTCTQRSPPSTGSLGQLKTGVYRVLVLIMQINNHCILEKKDSVARNKLVFLRNGFP